MSALHLFIHTYITFKQKGPGEPWGIQIGYITPLGEQIQIHIFYLLITVSIAEQNNQTMNKHI